MTTVSTAALAALFLLTGCGARIGTYQGDPSAAISVQDKICVLVGNDGTWDHTVYTGSGRVVAAHVFGVTRKLWPTTVLIEPKSPADMRHDVEAPGCAYLIIPSITRWEDRPQWSGRDHVTIALDLMRFDPWTLSRQVVFDQHSSNAAIANVPASDILDDGFDEAITDLVTPSSAIKPVPHQ